MTNKQKFIMEYASELASTYGIETAERMTYEILTGDSNSLSDSAKTAAVTLGIAPTCDGIRQFCMADVEREGNE